MPRLTPIGILLVALVIYGSFAAAKEEDDIMKLNKRDKGFPVPCNCTEWTCPRRFKGRCPPGPKCQHSQCKPIVAPDGSYCKPDNKCYVGYGKCKGGICLGETPIKCPPSSQECKTLTCDPMSGFCSILSNVEDQTPCRGGRCINGECIPGPNPCPTPEDPCKVAVRNPTTGRCVEQNAPNGRRCDDEDGCTRNDRCTNGVCVGRPKVCRQPSNPCKVSACDTDTGECVVDNADPGTQCPDGICAAGVCIDFFPQACPLPINPCLVLEFDLQVRRCVERPGNEGRACNDGNRCTTDDKCTGGTCVGTPLVCNSTEPCQVGQCNNATGLCEKVDAADGIACDDGSICIVGTTCQSGVCQGGNPFVCPANPPVGQCEQRVCNPSLNQCVTILKPDGSGCQTGNACTRDTCQRGQCVQGTATDCRQFDTRCTVGVCNQQTGVCEAQPRNEGSVCDDGKPCTASTTCQNGVCQGRSLAVCPLIFSQCKIPVCNDLTGRCEEVNRPAGTPCSRVPGTCTRDVCQAGVCVAGPEIPGACSTFNSNNGCRVGFCNTATGSCSVRDAQLGTPCDDGLVCTVGTTCAAGVCQGGSPRQCPPLTGLRNQCRESWCNPAAASNDTACQTRDKPDGLVCINPSPGCGSDTCQGGICIQGPVSDCSTLDGPCTKGRCINNRCLAVDNNEGNICPSRNKCVEGTRCSSGTCTGGTPVTCTLTPSGQCKRIVCLFFVGCVEVNEENGTTCDRNGCTVDDCQNGQCVGVSQRPGTCPDTNPLDCRRNTCNIGTGQCQTIIRREGRCSDGNNCTVNDQCNSSGQCVGTPKNCTSPSQCKSSTCDAQTGSCREEAVSGPCTDAADPCLENTVCQADGTCGGGTQNPDCQGPLPSPSPSPSPDPGPTCRPGTPCNDNNPCTIDDICNAQGQCVGTPKCPGGNQCFSNTCNPATGNCTVNVGQPCTLPRSSQCVTSPTCQADGTCAGTVKVCPPLDVGIFSPECAEVICNRTSGDCQTVFNVGGTCDDGDDDTCNDKCTADGKCDGDRGSACDNVPCRGGKPCPAADECCCANVCVPTGLNTPDCDFVCAQSACNKAGKDTNLNCNCIKSCGIDRGNECSSVGGNPCRANGVCCCATSPTPTTLYGGTPHCESCREECTGGNTCTGNLPTAQKEAICAAPSALSANSG